ncbi:CLUMA_CG007958, isoform A [Clunio marinus]|uniref:CLUMA_CG007958, isoform A n=1 Tax=Clunio marinus TaxID=568069 RepID=A0A1J1I2M2_9DIPT|nr:CLUMA_CG007958, isoform A [Clunio marinus]
MSQEKNNDDDIVVSGISGRFPNSDNIHEFEYNLYNKVDMADEEESRWKHFHPEVPKRTGKIRNLEKFDASFFSILNKHANQMDPQCRILLEHSYEAILDAGISPQSLVGSRTGVFIGCCFSDSKDTFLYRLPAKEGWGIFGNANFYLSNRISYALGLCGPSFTVDTACSSSAYALDCAYKYMMSGACDAAIVGGSQLVLNLASTMEYSRLGILAQDGYCRPFDKEASGFTRADTICVVFLQRQKNSKRVYARLMYTNSNNDGFKKEGSSFPSKIMQKQLIEEFFRESKIDPSVVNFVEAHSTGTRLGDPEEVSAIDEVFCKNTKRSKPLPIGSVKSNMGHAEASSGVASIAKILLTLENQKIPPNINITGLRDDVPAFAEKRIRVITETEDLDGPFISMNSFGLGGANAHALFKGNLKKKINKGLPSDDLERMVLWSGRTENSIKAVYDEITKRPLDVEFLALLQNSQIQTNTGNVYRGYGIFAQDAMSGNSVCKQQNIQLFTTAKRPIVWVFTGIGSQWPSMGTDLLRIPLFAKTIKKCHDVLVPKGMNLMEIITSLDPKTFDSVLHSYVGIAAIEIALTDVLKSLNLEPDYIIGHSVGELGAAYADNCFTVEEAMLASYSRGKASAEAKCIRGAMAAIGMNHKDVVKIVPNDIDIACHNSIDSTTISGPVDSVKAFVQELKSQNVFAREVACSGIPLHSRYITEMGKHLLSKLNDVIKTPKKRSAKWLSSSYPENQWNTQESQYSSGQYHTKNLLSPVLFEEVLNMLPENAMTVEIAPHGLLKSILKRSLKDGLHISLTQRDNPNGCLFMMEALGQLFQNGVDIDIKNLYTPVAFPVSRGTPMISPLIKWDHQENYVVPNFDSFNFFERRNIAINLSDKIFEFIQGHIIDGKVLFPGTGWLFWVWESFSMMMGVPQMNLKVMYEDVKFLRATSLQKNQDIYVTINIHRASGRFEIIEGKSAIAQGCIKVAENVEISEINVPHVKDSITLNEADFYKEMRLRGYYHRGLFRAVKEIRDDGLTGRIKWNEDWTTFTDCLIQFQVLMKDTRMLILPTRIRKMIIDPKLHFQKLSQINAEEKLLEVSACPYLNIIKAGGVEIHGFEGSLVNRRRPPSEPVLETHKFVPFNSKESFSKVDIAKVCVQLALENEPGKKFVSVEIDGKDGKMPLSESVFLGLADLPVITPEIHYLTLSDVELEGVSVSNTEFSSMSDMNLIIKANCINDKEFMKTAKTQLNGKGFILSREPLKSTMHELPQDIQLISSFVTENEKLLMLQFKKENQIKPETILRISSDIDTWIEPLKQALKKGSTLIYSQNDSLSGILGLVNCIRKEPNGDRLKCIFIDDKSAPKFDTENPFYKTQLEHGLAVNIYKNGGWGSYRHLKLKEIKVSKPRTSHYYANCLVKGDLSTLIWLSGPMTEKKFKSNNVKIQYASLNFRDIMLATGKINSDDVLNRIEQQSIMGFEFSGVTSDGRRIMGMGPTGALATHYNLNRTLTWDVPKDWTLEEAASVPLVYYTVYTAFFLTAKVEKGKSILIHAGCGGVGLAAIQVALAYGLKVFTTVGTTEKRNFLLDRFPSLKPEQIGNSRDVSFEKMVKFGTKGKGVDFVLNSLSEEKLQASIRCLGMNGVFLEIGKYDIMNKTMFDMGHFSKRIVFKAVFFDDIPLESEELRVVRKLVENDIMKGIVKPLKTNVFEANDIEQAFRFMASGRHIGKVLLKMRENANDIASLPFEALPRVYCDSSECYVLVGGLGGFGMELADWLVLRGCRKLVMSSSRGISNAYQASRIKVWQSYGVDVVINTSNIAKKSGCEDLIRAAMKLGPVGGIFNLAVALRDGIFENQDTKMFQESLAPKADATKFLDEISRKICPELKYFVIFSSVSCGRGNAGQSNYGMGNSIMERIMEERSKAGLPAKAIQWGAIGDVGLLADLQEVNMDMEISGTLPQRITNCLEVLDSLLNVDEPVVASMVVAEKRFEDLKKGNIVDAILNIMSIRDRKSISMDATLSRLGMDSLMGVEIQQILERDYDVVISSQEMRALTLSQLEKLVNNKGEGVATSNGHGLEQIEFLLVSFGDESTSDQTIMKLESASNDFTTKALLIPGFEGMAGNTWHNFAKKLNHPSYILQWGNVSQAKSLDDILGSVAKDILKLYSANDKFLLIGYSFGALLTLKIANFLESKGRKGSVYIIDGSPKFIQKIANQLLPDKSDESIQSLILLVCIRLLLPDEFHKVSEKVLINETWEKRLETFVEFAVKRSKYSAEYGSRMLTALIDRLKIALDADKLNFGKFKSQLTLIKASSLSVDVMDEDYGLSQYSEQKMNINSIEGDHITILSHPDIYKLFN